MARENQNRSNRLNKKVNREIDQRCHGFLHKLHSCMCCYELEDGPLPNLRDIFRPEAIDWFLSRSASRINDTVETRGFIKFVARTGYKDRPEVDEDGKYLLRRTTPIHHAMRNHKRIILPDLFKIYDRFDVNYTDEDGLTHFHVVCWYGCYFFVQRFLDHGQDPNCLWTKTGDSPLLLAVKQNSTEVAKLLLINGANPNLANEAGTTPLHYLCQKDPSDYDRDFIRQLFELSEQPVRIDARDRSGNTPLHVAMSYGQRWFVEFLLRRGADPNLVNAEGSTPLHIVCKENWQSGGILEVFFDIAQEVNRMVQVNAQDELGRTPLQWAVANLLPDVVELLLDRGADLSNFVFPTESYIVDGFQLPRDIIFELDFKMILPLHAMEVVELLERRGYELDRSDALTIMRVFAEYELFEKSDENGWHDKAKQKFGRSGRSLYDTLQLAPAEAAMLLRYNEYAYGWRSNAMYQLPEELEKMCAQPLCEKATRRFFRQWALDCLVELTHYRLPILCAEMIMDSLNNEDLFNICLAASNQSS